MKPARRWPPAALLFCACCATATTAAARTLPPIDVARDAPARATAAVAAASTDARYGVPTFLWGREVASRTGAATVAPKSAADAESAARAHLRELADVYRISAAEVDALPMHDLQRLPNGGAVVRFRGAVDGIDVFREQANVLLDAGGALVAVGGFVTGAPMDLRKRAQEALLAPEYSAAAALADFGFGPAVALRFASTPADGGYVRLALPAGTTAGDGATRVAGARAKRVWFRAGGDLVPAHYVEVRVRDGATRQVDYYAYVVSALDGTVLFRRNQVAHAAFSYRVYAEPATLLPLPGPGGRNGFPHPTGVPDGYQPPPQAASLITLQNAPFSKNDPWLPAGATKTIGNNAEAFADLVAPEMFGPAASDECNVAKPIDGDFHACANGAGAFDYVYDYAKTPGATRGQVMAGVTHQFYLVNFLHDWFYDAGFDEAAGNAQTNNFGRGGIGNDSLIVVTQDYTDIGNAYMYTPSDGERPELHMFVWLAGSSLAKVAAPAAVAGVKQAGDADFGATNFDLTASVVQALDAATAGGPSTTDGCSPLTNAAALAGRIALIDRGSCTFAVKAKNAQDAGAAAVLIANNVAPGAVAMAGDDPTITIPVLSVSLADGNAIKAQLTALATVSMRIARNSELRDGAIDTTVAAHEWGHYISNRLIADANGLNENQAVAMGEGWADFHEMLLLVKEADRFLPANAGYNGAYSSNGYPIGGSGYPPDVLNNAYYYGDRRYPYSRDMGKNPLTFRHITAGVPLPPTPVPSMLFSSTDNSEVHAAGEVWGSMLWECYSNLLNDTGRLTFAQAQDRMKRYLVASYKMTPVDPTFVSGRDALLAVMKAQDQEDYNQCLHGFAKRGAGLGAVAPASTSQDNAGVIESYRSVLPTGGTRAVAVEFYHAGFDHYFVSINPVEIANLDSGATKGWTRTGESFNVYADFPAGTAGDCRFFSTAFGEKSSHFYTSDVNECGVVRQNPSWSLEGIVFATVAPGPAGECPAGSIPVYRLYNNGQGGAPNHRYTTNGTTRLTMLARGWIPEGYGNLGVIMCSVT